MTETILLKNCRYIVTERGAILRKASISIEDGIIAEIGEKLEKTGLVIDCSDKIVIPGLVNCHTHIPTVLLKDLWDKITFEEYCKKIFEIEERLGPRLVYLISKLVIYGMLSTGTTAFTTTCLYPLEVARAASDLGIKAMVGPVFWGERKSKEFSKILRKLREVGESSLVRPALGAYFIQSFTSEDFSTIKELPESVHICFHVSETRREVYEFKNKHGFFPVEYLDKLGLITPKTQLVHLGWATSWELEIIKNKGASVVHCPTSDMMFATGGFLPFKELSRIGVTVGLGTDGGLDMFEEMKNFVLLQRNNYLDIEIGALNALRAATVEGGSIAGWNSGRITVGSPADLVLVSAESIYLQPLNGSVLQSLVYSGVRADVVMTIVNGRIVYRKEEMPKIKDEMSKILREVEAKLS